MSKPRSKLTFEQRHTFTIDNPVVSWSMYSSFKYDREQWYCVFVLGGKSSSVELTFGSKVADSMGTDKPLAPFTRLAEIEHEFDTYLGKIHLIGSMDTFQPMDKRRTYCTGGEFKTGVKPWDQKRVDEHGQLTFYTLCLWLQEQIHPDKINWFLEWAPTKKTENGDFYHTIEFTTSPATIVRFNTKRTMTQVLELAADIKKTHKEMIAYVKNHK